MGRERRGRGGPSSAVPAAVHGSGRHRRPGRGIFDHSERAEAARGVAEIIDLLDSRRYEDFVSDYLEFMETPGAGELVLAPG